MELVKNTDPAASEPEDDRDLESLVVPTPYAGRWVLRMETLRSQHLQIPDNAKHRLPTGKVLAVGPPLEYGRARRYPLPKVGDVILYEEEFVRVMEIEGRRGDFWIFGKPENIIAILEHAS